MPSCATHGDVAFLDWVAFQIRFETFGGSEREQNQADDGQKDLV